MWFLAVTERQFSFALRSVVHTVNIGITLCFE